MIYLHKPTDTMYGLLYSYIRKISICFIVFGEVIEFHQFGACHHNLENPLNID